MADKLFLFATVCVPLLSGNVLKHVCLGKAYVYSEGDLSEKLL